MSHYPFRIGIDLAALAPQKSGYGFYVENILAELRALEEESGVHIMGIDRVTTQLSGQKQLLWDQLGLPLTALIRGVDMLFQPAFSVPRFPKPVVVTAHDVYGLRYPDNFSGADKRYWAQVLPQSLRRADHIICISEFTKQELMTHLDISEDRMSVIYPAAGKAYRMIDDSEAIAARIRRLGVRAPFIVSVGTTESRKNYETLIQAFAFSKRGNHQLVIAGKKGDKFAKLSEMVRKYHLEDAVKFVDYIGDEDLVALYNACSFFVMPSVYEGFGLSALEAMQSGAAVIVSQNTALPEVVGDAGILFDPHDADDLRKRLDLLFDDIDLRRELQQKSVAQAARFSWKKAGEQTMAILQRAKSQ